MSASTMNRVSSTISVIEFDVLFPPPLVEGDEKLVLNGTMADDELVVAVVVAVVLVVVVGGFSLSLAVSLLVWCCGWLLSIERDRCSFK